MVFFFSNPVLCIVDAASHFTWLLCLQVAFKVNHVKTVLCAHNGIEDHHGLEDAENRDKAISWSDHGGYQGRWKL